EEQFFDRLFNLMELARNSISLKRKTLEKYTENGLYPYSRVYLSDIKKHTGEYWRNHFNTIGIIGMHEALMNFIGVGITDEDGLEFAKKVLKIMNDKLIEFQEEDDMLYNLEATPAEGTSYRLAKKDKELYPNIYVSGKGKPYYTNSTQLPVNCGFDLITALRHQDQLQPLYTGGTVFHSFIGEQIDDTQSLKELIRYISNQFRIPYFTITPTFSICPIHGYLKGEHRYCPKCKEEKIAEIDGKIIKLKNMQINI
ncbi:MAG: ribonucleoside triphosphate reductase, partial [Deferribacterales bacterium]